MARVSVPAGCLTLGLAKLAQYDIVPWLYLVGELNVATKVGTKGQVVIDRPNTRPLGIEPGMIAVQHVVDGAVVIRFQPAPHNRSLAGILRPHIRRWPSAEAAQERGRSVG